MKKEDRIQGIDLFHDYNLQVSTRTIYFGKGSADFNSSLDEVDCDSAAQAIKNFLILDNISKEEIIFYLNSPGGSWEDGIAVYDIIKSLSSPVKIIGVGKVYSMGSVIIQAGIERLITNNTALMIHDGSSGYVGDTKSSEAWNDFGKKIRYDMYKIYFDKMVKAKPAITLKDIEDMCGHDKIFDAKQAVEYGLVDRII
jgi:ATP-dependent Clp protease protease subunit